MMKQDLKQDFFTCIAKAILTVTKEYMPISGTLMRDDGTVLRFGCHALLADYLPISLSWSEFTVFCE